MQANATDEDSETQLEVSSLLAQLDTQGDKITTLLMLKAGVHYR